MKNKTRNKIVIIICSLMVAVNLFYYNFLGDNIKLREPKFFLIKVFVDNQSDLVLDTLVLGSYVNGPYKTRRDAAASRIEHPYGKDSYYFGFYPSGSADGVYLKYSFEGDEKEEYFDFSIDDLVDIYYPQSRLIIVNKDKSFEQVR